jgi:hypothetical protein
MKRFASGYSEKHESSLKRLLWREFVVKTYLKNSNVSKKKVNFMPCLIKLHDMKPLRSEGILICDINICTGRKCL